MASHTCLKRLVAYVEHQSAPHVAGNDQELLSVQILQEKPRHNLISSALAKSVYTGNGRHSENVLWSTLWLKPKIKTKNSMIRIKTSVTWTSLSLQSFRLPKPF